MIMKERFFGFMMLLLSISVVSCSDTIIGSNNIVSKQLNQQSVEAFDRIVVNDNIDVKVANGDGSVSIYAPDNVIERVVVESVNGTLTIGYVEGVKVMCDEEPTVYVTVPMLSQVVANESADVDVLSAGLMPHTFAVNGDGEIDVVQINVEQVEAQVVGSGSISLQGNATTATYKVEGSGEIDADEMVAAHVTATVDGRGEIECYAQEQLQATVNGLGEINYHGPATLQVQAQGRVNRDR